MGYIDADAHVDECEETWEYMDSSDADYKPVLLQPPAWGYLPKDDRPHPLWLIAGNVRLKRYRDDEITGTTQPMREMVDVPARIRHMDELGIEVQVLYPTMFLHAVTTQAYFVACHIVHPRRSESNRCLVDYPAAGAGEDCNKERDGWKRANRVGYLCVQERMDPFFERPPKAGRGQG